MAPSNIEALIEDADGMINAHAIALASKTGGIDFWNGRLRSSSGHTNHGDWRSIWLRCRPVALPQIPTDYGRASCSIAAIDGPFAAFKDADGLKRDCRVARLMGMNGKWAIHPGQAKTIAEHFTPSQTQVDQARKQKTAFEEALRQGQGTVAVDGAMVDQASINLLEPLLADAELLGM